MHVHQSCLCAKVDRFHILKLALLQQLLIGDCS